MEPPVRGHLSRCRELGWAISHRLKQVSKDALHVSDGSLYPALHKLEQRGWIKAEWKPTENNRRAKFYALTAIDAESSRRKPGNGAACPRPSLSLSRARVGH